MPASPPTRSRPLVLFALVVIASGCYRYLSREGGSTGLTFGWVMGALALLGAALASRGRPRAGAAVGLVAVLLTGGWFFYEALVLKGLAAAETRQLLVLGASVLTLVALCWPRRSSDPS